MIDADLQHPPEVTVELWRAMTRGRGPGGRQPPRRGRRRQRLEPAAPPALARRAAAGLDAAAGRAGAGQRSDERLLHGPARARSRASSMHPLGYKILVEVIGRGKHPLDRRGRLRVPRADRAARARSPGASTSTTCGTSCACGSSALSTSRFLRFALVGASGVVVDMALLFLLSDPRALGFGLTRSKIVAAELAIINNFLWNDAWTFRDLVGDAARPAPQAAAPAEVQRWSAASGWR